MILRLLKNLSLFEKPNNTEENPLLSSNPTLDFDATIDLDQPINLDSTPAIPTMESDGLFK